MDLEALVVIGVFILVLGAVLFGLTKLWMKYKSHEYPAASVKIKMTKVGVVWLSLAIIVLLAGLLMQYLAPESLLGKFVKTASGRFFYAVSVAFLFWLLEIVLKAKGIKLIDKIDLTEKDS
ncbi:MAG: hypothetical protein AB1560_04335 [Pseudomonadota bacterium]